MASVIFYFQVHQPYRLRRYSVFHRDPFYFDDAQNERILRKVADKCYRPATRLILDLVERHEGDFRVAYSLTGTVLEQLERWAPDVLELFQELASTGCCEFLGETYYHSLASLYSPQEFAEQVTLHTRRIEELFGQTPRVFRNTELIYSDHIAELVSRLTSADGAPQFKAVLAEGVDRLLGHRSPNHVYSAGRELEGDAGGPLAVLVKNYRLSDDIAFRFSNRGWSEWPLSADKFARWVHQINGDGEICNLFMDYETFGEHQWADSGIFEFLDKLPRAVLDLAPGRNGFMMPSEAVEGREPVGAYYAPEYTSWADSERDLTAWRGNAMQENALEEFYRLEAPIKRAVEAAGVAGDEHAIASAGYLIEDWRKVSTSDHFYYMCTKFFADGDVHRYFNPYDSPYDSYINFMNVLDNMRERIVALRPQPAGGAPGAGAATA